MNEQEARARGFTRPVLLSVVRSQAHGICWACEPLEGAPERGRNSRKGLLDRFGVALICADDGLYYNLPVKLFERRTLK